MRIFERFKARYPKLVPVLAATLALGTVGGIAAYERYGSAESCCYPGAPCCQPGAACCNGAHRHAAN